MNSGIQQKQLERLELLNALYEAVGGRADVMMSYAIFRDRLSFKGQRAWDHVQYLQREGLLEFGNGGWIAITHRGVVEVERARQRPHEPTEYFEVGVIHNTFHGPVGAVQTGPGATANVVQHIGAAEQQALFRALDLVAEIASSRPTGSDGWSADKILELVRECRCEVTKSSPNLARIIAVASGIGMAIQTVGAFEPAYGALKAALGAIGVPILP